MEEDIKKEDTDAVSAGLNFSMEEVKTGITNTPLKAGINVSYLTKVEYSPNYTKKKTDKVVEQPTIDFHFADLHGERKSMFREFDPSTGEKPKKGKSLNTMFNFYKSKFGAIYEAYFGKAPAPDLFAGCNSIKEVFERSAELLNKGGEDNTRIYILNGKPRLVNLKTSYYQTNIQLPIEQFIEMVKFNDDGTMRESLLSWNPKYDQKEPTASASNGGGGGTPGNMEEFEDDDLPM